MGVSEREGIGRVSARRRRGADRTSAHGTIPPSPWYDIGGVPPSPGASRSGAMRPAAAFKGIARHRGGAPASRRKGSAPRRGPRPGSCPAGGVPSRSRRWLLLLNRESSEKGPTKKSAVRSRRFVGSGTIDAARQMASRRYPESRRPSRLAGSKHRRRIWMPQASRRSPTPAKKDSRTPTRGQDVPGTGGRRRDPPSRVRRVRQRRSWGRFLPFQRCRS